jgi:hypothetical protein
MRIATIFARVSCRDIETSLRRYDKLFGMAPIRRPAMRMRDRDENLVVFASARRS